jgi:hypothetical protein
MKMINRNSIVFVLTGRSDIAFIILMLLGVHTAVQAQNTSYAWDDGGDQMLWSSNGNWDPDGPLVVDTGAGNTHLFLQVGVLGVTQGYTQTIDTPMVRTAAQTNTCRQIYLSGDGNNYTVTAAIETDGTPLFNGDSTMTMTGASTIGFPGTTTFDNGFDVILNDSSKIWANDNQAHATFRNGATGVLHDNAQLDNGTRGFFAVDGAGSVVTMDGAGALIRNGESDVRFGGKLIVNDGTFNWNNRNNRLELEGGEIQINGGTFQMGLNLNFNNRPGLIRLDGGTRTGAANFNVNFNPNGLSGEQELVISGIDSFVSTGKIDFNSDDLDVTSVVTVEGVETSSIGFDTMDVDGVLPGFETNTVIRFIPDASGTVTPIALANGFDLSKLMLAVDDNSVATPSSMLLLGAVSGTPYSNDFHNISLNGVLLGDPTEGATVGAWTLTYDFEGSGGIGLVSGATPRPRMLSAVISGITSTITAQGFAGNAYTLEVAENELPITLTWTPVAGSPFTAGPDGKFTGVHPIVHPAGELYRARTP